MADAGMRGGRRHGHLWRIVAWSAAAGLILLPLAAMQFTDEVNWDLFDFAFAIVLVGSVGIALELALRMMSNAAWRAGAVVALATTFLLVWINAAVSIIGGDDNPAKPLYFGVLAVAVLGAAIARLRAGGMARAMMAAAVAQVAVPVIAQFTGLGVAGFDDIRKVLILTAAFAGMWLVAAWLFWRGAR